MLVVMKNDATEAQIDAVCVAIEKMGYEPHKMPGAQRTAICITGNKGAIEPHHFANLEGIFEVIRVSKPYKLTSKEIKPDPTVIQLGKTQFGGGQFGVIAGPCSVEDEDVMMRNAEKLKNAGVDVFRAGAYKPRTNPYSFQGKGVDGLKILDKIKATFEMAIVTEVLDADDIAGIRDVADAYQVGTRNMQNYALLKKLGKERTPVILKRGMCATMDEFLQAAEYIMAGGNKEVILCERGIRTFANHSRNTLDVTIVPALQELTHLPIIIDPSHAAGKTFMVPPLMRCAAALGCDGLIVECHDDAANAWSDGAQAVDPAHMRDIMAQCEIIRSALPQ